jgi:hypothetical protein
MVETVRPVALPPELKVTIRGACDTLAPQDALDTRLRRGLAPSKDDATEITARKRAARAAAVRLASALDKEGSAEFLAPCAGWLDREPKADDVQAHLLAVGLLEEFSAGATRGARPMLGSPARKACYSALLTFKESVPSACAQRLYDVAMILARAYEVGSHKESGSAHAYVAGLISAGA